jgi:ADP-ribosylation factor 2-binding protein
MDPDFEDARETFCRSNCGVFEDNDENKLIYTDIFSRYTELVEGSIEKRLKEAVPDFDMQKFQVMLDARKDELMSEVFDLLLSLGDFETFKEVMLSYKEELSQDASSSMQIHCSAMRLYSEEQEDGDERPDLDFGLTISPVGPGPANKRF